MSKKWFMFSQKVNTDTPTDFDKTKRIYVDEYSFCRANRIIPVTPGALFETYCEDIPANLDYNTLNTIVQQQQVHGSTTVTHTNWGISKLLVKKEYQTQNSLTYNEDYLTGTQYTDGNTITGVCIYNVSKYNFNTSIYLDEYIDVIENNQQIQKAYKVTTTDPAEKPAGVYHGTTGYMGVGINSTLDTKPFYIIGKDTQNDTIATLTNLQSLTTSGIYTNWTHWQQVSTQPFTDYGSSIQTDRAGQTNGYDYTPILKYPVAKRGRGILGTYNYTTFYFNYMILALPKNAVITDINIFGGI